MVALSRDVGGCGARQPARQTRRSGPETSHWLGFGDTEKLDTSVRRRKLKDKWRLHGVSRLLVLSSQAGYVPPPHSYVHIVVSRRARPADHVLRRGPRSRLSRRQFFATTVRLEVREG